MKENLVGIKDNFQSRDIENNDQAIEKIIQIFSLENSDLKKHLILLKDSDKLLKEISSQLNPLNHVDFSPEKMNKKIEFLTTHYQGSSVIMKTLLKKALLKRKRIERELNLLQLEKLKILKYHPYLEEFNFLLEDLYEVYDNPSSINFPSHWKYTKSNLNGHLNAITQVSAIECVDLQKGCTPTMLLLKYKDFYDCVIEISILMRGNGLVGVCFRVKDPFNFYIFEMKAGKFKRIRKVIDGVSSVLIEIEDGGFKQNVWYKV